MPRRRAATFVYESTSSILKPFLLFNCRTKNRNFIATASNLSPVTSKRLSEEETQTTEGGRATTMEEADVGIACYISQLPGFRGILKQRYSDFIVNEVDLEGNVVRLTSLEVPPEMVHKKESQSPKPSDKDCSSEIEAFRSLAGDFDADLLKDFINKINSGSEDGISAIVLSPISDKPHRTAVHNFFKEKLRFLVTDTVDGPDASSKCIRIRLDSGGSQTRGGNSSRKRKNWVDNNKPFDSRGSENWPEHLGKFLRFHLYKENKDIQEALRLIGKMLGIQTRSFGFAGTKDKRAVTTQRVTVFKQLASRLASLNEKLIGIKVGDFCHVKEGLQLGQLLGNRFMITLRAVVADSEDTIKSSAVALGNHGFINYFGLQRFGSGTVPTHRIGAALLRGEWKTAVDMILDPREGDILFSTLLCLCNFLFPCFNKKISLPVDIFKETLLDSALGVLQRDDIKMIREYYKESNDIDGTLRQMPHNMVAERTVLQCLKKYPGNYLQALKAIPRTLRMMYVHSYQSYLWNHAASMRVQKYGSEKVTLGDLVYSTEETGDKCEEAESSEVEADCSVDRSNCSNFDVLPDTELLEARSQRVKLIDTEELLKGTYTIDDVVLPLPGSRATYPANGIASLYHDLANKDNISLTESVHNVKEFSITIMPGGYRRVFQKMLDFEWELLRYTDGNKPLAETDLDVITRSKPVNIDQPEPFISSCKNDNSNVSTVSERSEGDAKSSADDKEINGVGESTNSDVVQTALKLSFTLPASSYATMAIRELLKTSTSVAFHKTLNNQV